MIFVLVIIFGLIIGSFLNVIIYRVPRGISIIRPGSHCQNCKEPIKWYDNIPLISYIILRGRCRHCKSPISWKYPAVELITALSLFLIVFKYRLSSDSLIYTILILFLIPISFIDLERKLILNKLTIPCFILGILLITVLQNERIVNSLIGGVAGGAIILIISVLGRIAFKKESMGMGDMKLLVITGIYVGFPGVLLCLFFGIIVSGIYIFSGMLLKKIKLGDTISFGPFIAIGTLVYLIFGDLMLGWYVGLL